MEDILRKIIEKKQIEVELSKDKIPANQLYKEVETILSCNPENSSFRSALESSKTGIIAEFKRKSPSLGWIKEDGKPNEIPFSYQECGATAVSILTDEPFFGGNLNFIKIARENTHIPILRKDFIVDEYQLFQAKSVKADAILLIASCLSRERCKSLAKTARELKLDVLLEVHNENELEYITPEVSVVGVNNRNLHEFRTDIDTSFRLASMIPDDFLKISESGLKTPDIVRELRQAGYRGFLMGERFMKEPNPGEALKQFISQLA